MRSFDSGSLGNPTFEIDSLLPRPLSAMVQVQLGRQEAEALIRWHRPEIVGPIAEQYDLADSDSFCDAVIEAVHAWVATFPLLHSRLRSDPFAALREEPRSRER